MGSLSGALTEAAFRVDDSDDHLPLKGPPFMGLLVLIREASSPTILNSTQGTSLLAPPQGNLQEEVEVQWPWA